ncbi:zinc finger protein 263 isoform X4 [Oncorhynchus mykiss]|uniref:zinc finger protein 263 isoform X4 n=1 Tax=Oncorhynchus mykiss TaxID=8022 RepID=UPI001878B285|nr:zinc finger protein 263 isoform X4 [Oncorhynchus mykiss]
MANCMVFHTQIASIMEVLANAAVAEICKLVDDDYAVLRVEISQSQKENRGLRRKLQLLELKVARERAERTIRERVLASRPSSVKILDRYRGMARGEGHLTGGHRSFVKPAGHNAWRDDQPISIDEGSGISTQHVIVIESADAEAAGPGGLSLVKQERTEGDDPRHSRDIQTGAVAGVAPLLATEDPTAPPQPRNRRSITEEEEDPEVLLVKEESLGNPEGTMVMEDNQTTPPPEPTEEPTEQHRTTHSLTESAVHEDLLISSVAGGRDWTSEVAVHKPWPRIRIMDQEPSLFLPESDPGPNREGQRLYHHTEHNQRTGGLNNLRHGGHQRGSSPQPRPFSSQSQCRDGAGPGADGDRPSCSYDTNTTVSMMKRARHPGLQPSERVEGDSPDGNLTGSLSSLSGSRLMPSDWVHKRPGPGSSLTQLLHGYPTNTAHNPNNTQTMTRGGSSKTNHLSVVAPASTSPGVIGSQRGRQSIRGDADKPYACPTCGKRFAQSNYVKMHQTVHTKEKPFKCKLCYKSFSFLTNLTRHKSVHNGEKL